VHHYKRNTHILTNWKVMRWIWIFLLLRNMMQYWNVWLKSLMNTCNQAC